MSGPLLEGGPAVSASRLADLKKWAAGADEACRHISVLRRMHREQQQGRRHNAEHPCADVQ